MHAMILSSTAPLSENRAPLKYAEWPDPEPGNEEVLIRVHVCGVCHTELDEIEGRTPPPQLPVILGHQVVGKVEALGKDVKDLDKGQRVGVAWIFSACGKCRFCLRGEENLCPDFLATGRDRNGGYAEFICVPAAYAHPIPEVFTDAQAAPLLCAGAVGYRSLRLTELKNGQNLGLTGFGASGHLVLQMALHKYPDSQVCVFARRKEERQFALDLGAHWAGDTMDAPPFPLHAIIDTTPAWLPVLGAMQSLEPGGRLVINAIRKEAGDQEELLKLDYPEHLWMEKEIKSVANVTRQDVREFLDLAAKVPIKPEVQEFPLQDANQALLDMKNQDIRGAKVLRVASSDQ